MSDADLLVDGPKCGPVPTVVLAHGAGAPMDSPFMEFMAAGLAEAKIRVVRFEFPYMRLRRETGSKKPPDREPVLRAAWLEVINQLRKSGPAKNGQLVIGGKSMGGRMASLVANEANVDGLICLGYPFHPPGRPEKLRVDHLRELKPPTLIIQGERDPFGKREEVASYKLPKKIGLHWLVDGDHSFKPRKASGRTEAQNCQEAVQAMVKFVESL